jgi:hypothetical protein
LGEFLKGFSTADGNPIRAHHSVIVFGASLAAITYTDRVAIRQAAPIWAIALALACRKMQLSIYLTWPHATDTIHL